jgi:glutathione S-transferase
MKLYMHPVSMTSRPVRLFIQENGIPCEEQVVDLMTGEHVKEPYVAINPNKFESPLYPKDLKKRAKVNEMMDWFNTNFYRDYGYGMAYPQIFGHHKRPTDEAQAATIKWGVERAHGWLKVLDTHWIGPKNQYVCGNDITIADYFGVCLVTLGEVLRVDFSPYPNVTRWLGNMKKLKSWDKVNEVLYGFRDSVKEQAFITS